MLFDQRWDRRRPLTWPQCERTRVPLPLLPTIDDLRHPVYRLDELIKTLAEYAPDQEYNFHDITNCPLAKHFARFGCTDPVKWTGASTNHLLPCVFMNVVGEYPHTYGAALARAKRHNGD